MNRDIDDEKYNFTIVRLEKNRVHVYIYVWSATKHGKEKELLRNDRNSLTWRSKKKVN